MALDTTDKTSNGNNLTNNNSVAEETSSLPYVASLIAAIFSRASSRYLSITNAAQTGLGLTNNFTIEFWVKVTSMADGQTHMCVSKFDSEPQLGYAVGLIRSGSTYSIRFYYSNNGSFSGFSDLSKALGIDPTGAWHHIAVTFSSGTVEYFLDGVSKGTSSGSGNVYNGTSTFKIGTEGSNYLNATLDDVRVWNVVRTGTEINNNKSANLTGNETGLVGYWPFETLITTAIKKAASVAYASIKKIVGVAIASVKKLAGVA